MRKLLDEREYTLVEHLSDLRYRLVRALLGVGLATLAAFFVSEAFLDLLRIPLDVAVKEVGATSAKFVVIAPAEYFIAQLKAALVLGLFVASPWVLFQVWKFVAPGLYVTEQRYVAGFVWAGSFFFVAGGVFAYMLVFPPMFRFFIEATHKAGIEMTLSVAEHLGFSLKMLVAFGVVFQAPVIVFVLALSGIVETATFARIRPYVMVGGFVVGAILTPPDIFSQTLLAIPLVVLYEGGLLAARLVMKVRGPRPPRVSAVADPVVSANDAEEGAAGDAGTKDPTPPA